MSDWRIIPEGWTGILWRNAGPMPEGFDRDHWLSRTFKNGELAREEWWSMPSGTDPILVLNGYVWRNPSRRSGPGCCEDAYGPSPAFIEWVWGRGWVLDPPTDGGDASFMIDYCPWCGSKLPDEPA